jgi:hypothetical protein
LPSTELCIRPCISPAEQTGEFYVEPERESRPQRKVDHSAKAPLKSDMKAGVQENQQPGVKIPKKDEKNKHSEGTKDQGKK